MESNALTNFSSVFTSALSAARRAAQSQVDVLLDAGWSFNFPQLAAPEPWEWHWRRPGRRVNARTYRGTHEAFRALQRGRGAKSLPS